ncbi:hypothetical protein PCE1_000040 [Barthelona sp. PCE]
MAESGFNGIISDILKDDDEIRRHVLQNVDAESISAGDLFQIAMSIPERKDFIAQSVVELIRRSKKEQDVLSLFIHPVQTLDSLVYWKLIPDTDTDCIELFQKVFKYACLGDNRYFYSDLTVSEDDLVLLNRLHSPENLFYVARDIFDSIPNRIHCIDVDTFSKLTYLTLTNRHDAIVVKMAAVLERLILECDDSDHALLLLSRLCNDIVSAVGSDLICPRRKSIGLRSVGVMVARLRNSLRSVFKYPKKGFVVRETIDEMTNTVINGLFEAVDTGDRVSLAHSCFLIEGFIKLVGKERKLQILKCFILNNVLSYPEWFATIAVGFLCRSIILGAKFLMSTFFSIYESHIFSVITNSADAKSTLLFFEIIKVTSFKNLHKSQYSEEFGILLSLIEKFTDNRVYHVRTSASKIESFLVSI